MADLNEGMLLLHGPLVTYSLRESFWGQRHSLGLWVERCLTSNRDLQQTLLKSWAIDAEVAPRLEPAGSGGLGASPERELLIYSRRGGRLLGSRVAISGRGRISVGGRAPRGRDGRGPRAVLRWWYTDARVDLFDPGREYDI